MANVPKGMGIGGGCDEEALRGVNSITQFKPGKQNGHAVPVWFTVPVIFKLQ
jgi:protein TonB